MNQYKKKKICKIYPFFFGDVSAWDKRTEREFVRERERSRITSKKKLMKQIITK